MPVVRAHRGAHRSAHRSAHRWLAALLLVAGLVTLAGTPARAALPTVQAQRLPAPSEATGGAWAPQALSCGADGDCAAVGQFTPSTTHPVSPVSADVESGGTWTAHALDVPSDAQTQGGATGSLPAVACPAAGQCLAVGSYTVKGDPSGATGTCAHDEPRVLTESLGGGTWTDSEVVAPGAPCDNAQADEVACAGTSWCTALGFMDDADGQTYEWMGTGTVDGIDSSTTVPTPSSATGVGGQEAGIACATSASLCLSLGIDGSGGGSDIRPNYVLVGTNGSWGGAQAIPVPHTGDTEATLENVACSATRCYGVGSYVDGSGHEEGYVASTDGSTWAYDTLGSGEVVDISCGHTTCVALEACGGSDGCSYTALSSQTGAWQSVDGPVNTGYRCPTGPAAACLGRGLDAALYSLSDGVATQSGAVAMPTDCADEDGDPCGSADYPFTACAVTECTTVQPYTDTDGDAAAAVFAVRPTSTGSTTATRPKITLTCTPDPVRAGSRVTCTVTVANPTAGATTRPSGEVRIGTGAASDPACTLTPAGTGASSCRVTFDVPSPGTATITARYAGNATFAAGTASTTEVVQADPATVGGLKATGTAATLVATCPPGGGACRLEATLTTTVTSGKGGRVAARPASGGRTKRTVTVGSAHATVKAGKRATLKVTLSKAGRKLLATKGTVKVTLTVRSVSTGGGSRVVARRTLTFRSRHRR